MENERHCGIFISPQGQTWMININPHAPFTEVDLHGQDQDARW